MSGTLRLLVPLAWRNLWRNPRRTSITLIVVAVGMWSILIFGVMLNAFAASTKQQALRVLTGEGQIHASGYLDSPGAARTIEFPHGGLLSILNSPRVTGWAARVRVPAVVESEYRARAVTLVGADPASELRVSDLPRNIASGRYLADQSDPSIVIGRDLALHLRTRLGKRIIVSVPARDGHLAQAGLTIVGLFTAAKPTEDEFVFIGRATAQNMLGIGNAVSEVSFDATDEDALPKLVESIRHVAVGDDVKSWMDLSPIAYAIEQFSETDTAIWLLIMFALMAIGIVNTQLMAVFERTREFGLLRALGMRPAMVLLQVTLESAYLVGLGVLAGVAATELTLLPFRGGLDLGSFATGAEMVGVGRVLHPNLLVDDALRFSLIVWLLGIAAGYWPARRASRTEPATAMAQR